MSNPITYQDVITAESRIRPFLNPTPLRNYSGLDELVGSQVFVKHENHLPTNAFKARNAFSALTALTDEQRGRGVIAATRGNHGMGVAFAAKTLGMKATICVPIGNNPEKNADIRGYGATLIEQGRDYDESVAVMQELVKAKGLTEIHSTNNPNIIAGAGTLTLEILNEVPDLDLLFVAVGGGSQAVGAITVIKEKYPNVKVIGVQAAGASAIHDSWHKNEMMNYDSAKTFADGLATRSTYPMTFSALRSGLSDFVTVTDAEIAEAIRVALKTTHNLVEGAGAAGLAALLKVRDKFRGKKIGVIFSGSNIDQETLRKILQKEI